MGSRPLFGLILLSLLACGREGQHADQPVRLLPAHLSVVVERVDGTFASVLLPLRRNARDQLDVRIFEGFRLYDGRTVFEFDETDGTFDVHDLVRDKVARLQRDGRLLGAQHGYAWIEGERGVFRCHLATGACQASPGMPEMPLTQAGPLDGFAVSLSGSVLRVRLPRMTQPKPVFDGVARLVSVHWVRNEDPAAHALVDLTYRGQATLPADARACVLDGDLGDWAGLPVAVVENPWQLQHGGPGWRGGRDASFGVVASWTAEQVCFAGRVRDDAVGEGDHLRLQVEGVALDVPLVGELPAEARRSSAWHGVAYEACVPSASLPQRGDLAFRATFYDADPDEPVTALSTAPEEEGRPLGHLVLLAPPAVARPGT